MNDLETAILDILRRARPAALVLTEIHAHLITRGWAVPEVLPLNITLALIALGEEGLIFNELSWRAAADAALTDAALQGQGASEPKP